MGDVEGIFDPERQLILKRKIQHDGRQFVVKFPKKFERLLKLNKENGDYFEFKAELPRDRRESVRVSFRYIGGEQRGKKKKV